MVGTPWDPRTESKPGRPKRQTRPKVVAVPLPLPVMVETQEKVGGDKSVPEKATEKDVKHTVPTPEQVGGSSSSVPPPPPASPDVSMESESSPQGHFGKLWGHSLRVKPNAPVSQV